MGTMRRAYQTLVHPIAQPLRAMIRFEKHPAVYFKSRPEPPRYPRWMANETGTLNDFPRSLHRPSPRLYPHHCWIQSTPAVASCSRSLKSIPHSTTTPFMQSTTDLLVSYGRSSTPLRTSCRPSLVRWTDSTTTVYGVPPHHPRVEASWKHAGIV